MTRKRPILVSSVLLLLVVVTGVASAPVAYASHGFGYADCPLDVDLSAADRFVTRGERVDLSGELLRDDQADISNITIRIQRRFVDSDVWDTRSTVQTDADGDFDYNFTAWRDAFWRAVFPETEACPRRVSPSVRVRILCPGYTRSDGNHLPGTGDADTLVGTGEVDIICGFGSGDVLIGAAAGDVLLGGRGADTLSGNRGGDVLVGGPGADEIRGGDGDDDIDAEDGISDVVRGGQGADTAQVDPGDDVSGVESTS